MMVASWPFFNLIKLTYSRVYPLLKQHISFYSYHLAIWHSFPDITNIKFNNGLKLAILVLINRIFSGYITSFKLHILFYSNCLHIWYGLLDIKHNLFYMFILKVFRTYPYREPHIFFHSNGLAIWYGLSDIRNIKVNYANLSNNRHIKVSYGR